MRLDELAAQVDLPPTTAADSAWAEARRRRTRRVAASTATVGSGVAVALVAVLTTTLHGGDDPAPPTSTPTSTSSPSRPGGAASATPLPDPPALDPAVVMPELRLPDLLGLLGRAPELAPTDLTELSADPVRRAVIAVATMGVTEPERWTTIDVLGDDGGWRHVDVPGLRATDDGNGYSGYALDVTSLSQDGTRLAIPQADGLVVVDLTTGTARRYDVTGPWKTVLWQDADHVALLQEGRADARVVDLATGSVSATEATATTGYLPDGSWVRWGRPGSPLTPRSNQTLLTSSDGTRLATVGNDEGGLESTAPLADADVVVGLGNLLDFVEGRNQSGPTVVDRRTGAVLGVWPVSDADLANAQLLALEGHTVLVALPAADGQVVVVRWDWEARSTDPVAVIPALIVSVAGDAAHDLGRVPGDAP